MSLHDLADACIQFEWNRFVANGVKELEDSWAQKMHCKIKPNLEPKRKLVQLCLKPKLKPALKTDKKPKNKRPILAFSKAKKSRFIAKVKTIDPIKRTRIPWKSSVNQAHLESLISLMTKNELF